MHQMLKNIKASLYMVYVIYKMKTNIYQIDN
jgi:hypothetical protein